MMIKRKERADNVEGKKNQSALARANYSIVRDRITEKTALEKSKIGLVVRKQ